MRTRRIAVLAVVAGLWAAVVFTEPGARAFGAVRTWAFPRDPALLAYAAPDGSLVAVVQFPFGRAPDGENLKRLAEQVAGEFEQHTGVRAARDVDAVLWTDHALHVLTVMRGRFDWKRLSPVLQRNGYQLGELEGARTAVLAGVMLAVDGRYLINGPEQEVREAIHRQRESKNAAGSALLKALDDAGWRHLVTAVVINGVLGKAANLELELALVMDMPPHQITARARGVFATAGDAERAAKELEDGRQKLADDLRRNPDSGDWVKVVERVRIRSHGDPLTAGDAADVDAPGGGGALLRLRGGAGDQRLGALAGAVVPLLAAAGAGVAVGQRAGVLRDRPGDDRRRSAGAVADRAAMSEGLRHRCDDRG